jgi:hypothetical protein
VANSIREDPRKQGLLYAATDLQVWVSTDDGDHWRSLKFDMPSISVRDIQVKDDSTVSLLGSRRRHARTRLLDSRQHLVVATGERGAHRRVVWQALPLQAGDGRACALRHERSHAVAARVPAGENPLPGGIIDYTLAGNASSPVTLDILDGCRER